MVSMMLCCLMMRRVMMMVAFNLMHMYSAMLRHMLSMSMMSTMSFIMHGMLVHGPCCQIHLQAAYQDEKRDTAHCDEGEITENALLKFVALSFKCYLSLIIHDEFRIFTKKNKQPFLFSTSTLGAICSHEKFVRPTRLGFTNIHSAEARTFVAGGKTGWQLVVRCYGVSGRYNHQPPKIWREFLLGGGK